jgi:hypothetical protein
LKSRSKTLLSSEVDRAAFMRALEDVEPNADLIELMMFSREAEHANQHEVSPRET